MRQKLFIFLGLILLILVLVGLNAASYTQKEKTPDSEIEPNRSTYNSGATGTQVLYSLLAETGRKVIRWQEPPATLATVKDKPAVFVVVGSVRREFTDAEIEHQYQKDQTQKYKKLLSHTWAIVRRYRSRKSSQSVASDARRPYQFCSYEPVRPDMFSNMPSRVFRTSRR